jgi:hypothetical protein
MTAPICSGSSWNEFASFPEIEPNVCGGEGPPEDAVVERAKRDAASRAGDGGAGGAGPGNVMLCRRDAELPGASRIWG